MHCSIANVKHDNGATGVLYDVGIVYAGLSKLTDMRKPQGKLYQVERVGVLRLACTIAAISP